MRSIDRHSGWLATALLCMIALAMLGCSRDGPKIVRISGRVTRGGRPVADLKVNFVPASGRPSWGFTDPDGRYTLHYTRDQDGACVGKHKVFVKYSPRPSDPGEEMKMLAGGFRTSPDIRAIEKRYGSQETTPLEFDIQEDRDDLDLALD
jgi:hypothetical protein